MCNRVVVQRLTDIRLGDELCDGDRQSLARISRLIDVGSGETLFREGEKHSQIYWLVKGRINLEMSTGGTTAKLLMTLGRGDLFAWSAMLSGGRMTSTATTTQPSRLLAFDAVELSDLCRRNHEVGYCVMEHLAKRLAKRLLATRLQLLDLFHHPSESE